ncbi:MAG TPA: alpha-amylase family glycosyl hydrolase [Candidatus Krumholzibacteria bacterium]|nr:alpha-amylase family glycosyl hydrolase [Candidatus Krumholzibacteria bacterium]
MMHHRLPLNVLPVAGPARGAAALLATRLSELADARSGPPRAQELAALLRARDPHAPPGGELLAAARWLAAAALAAAGLLRDAHAADRLWRRLRDDLGADALDRILARLAQLCPELAEAAPSLADDGAGLLGGGDERSDLLARLAVLSLALRNPALAGTGAVLGLPLLDRDPDVGRLLAAVPAALAQVTVPGPGGDRDAWSVLTGPIHAAPDRLDEQLLAAAHQWSPWLGELGAACTVAAGVLREERRPRFDGPGPAPVFQAAHAAPETPAPAARAEAPVIQDVETVNFSEDRDWMPRAVVQAKNAYVWLHQLSERYGEPIATLDRIPDAELDALQHRGVTGLWMIGLWQRSPASKEIKRRMGNPEALASAYALEDYRIADDLGGDEALDRLRERALARGIRLCGDMVPNHTGLDGRWVRERPELFMGLDHPPFPGYAFEGPDLTPEHPVEIKLEDGYWERRDAAVVFRRRDRHSGDVRYLYHGNDGTSMPWNDTAQLDYLNPATREAVIRTILDVARRFHIIRFDAAMVLTRRHVRRLWWPEPGEGSDIASRAAHALPRAEFDAAMPKEFWREVVDRVAAEAPDTLLLAEAFWLLEGYFVRTLGMHRVYNSAFMHMLRDQDNASFRGSLRNVLEFDPGILQRFVNFVTNPDEETAVEQFGKGDKYFGICTLLATLPGLPLIGHGQFEGLGEKYGMEYGRSYHEEPVDEGLLAHHERMIFPLLRRRHLFAGAERFRLYDAIGPDGHPVDDLIAFTNAHGDERALVVYNNSHEARGGRLDHAFGPGGAPGEKLVDALGLGGWEGEVVLTDERSGEELRRRVDDLRRQGLIVELPPYGCRVFTAFRSPAAEASPPSAEARP